MKTTRDLILKYMRSKRVSCEVKELCEATSRSHGSVYQTLLKLKEDGIIRDLRGANSTVRWALMEMEAK